MNPTLRRAHGDADVHLRERAVAGDVDVGMERREIAAAGRPVRGEAGVRQGRHLVGVGRVLVGVAGGDQAAAEVDRELRPAALDPRHVGRPAVEFVGEGLVQDVDRGVLLVGLPVRPDGPLLDKGASDRGRPRERAWCGRSPGRSGRGGGAASRRRRRPGRRGRRTRSRGARRSAPRSGPPRATRAFPIAPPAPRPNRARRGAGRRGRSASRGSRPRSASGRAPRAGARGSRRKADVVEHPQHSVRPAHGEEGHAEELEGPGVARRRQGGVEHHGGPAAAEDALDLERSASPAAGAASRPRRRGAGPSTAARSGAPRGFSIGLGPKWP